MLDQDDIAWGRSRSAASRRSRRATGSRGAAVVEAALTLPLVIMLLFGMITGGVALGQRNAIENAAREASRFGATLEVTTATEDWLDDVSAVAIAAATGELDPGTPGRLLCVALVGTSTGDDGRLIIDGDTTSYGYGSCPDMSCPTNRACVQVVLERDGYLDLVFTSQSLALDASSVTTFERN